MEHTMMTKDHFRDECGIQ